MKPHRALGVVSFACALAGPAAPVRAQESPEPEPVATAPASVAPSPSPSPALAVPIVVDRARVGIVPGTTVTIAVSGGAGPLSATPPGPNVDVRYDPVARTLVLAGRAPGSTTVTLSDAAGDATTVAVLVAPPAGIVPPDLTVELGGNVSPAFAATKIASAIEAVAQLRPGTHVDVRDATPGGPLAPGDSLEATAHVHVDGAGAYVDVDGTTTVHLRVDTLARLDPQILFYSDDPERLLASTDGVVYRATLDPAKPARAYVYHVADGSTHRLSLVLRALGADARVQILGDSAGPTDAFSYVGHLTTLRYLLARGSQESSIVTVDADAPYVQQLGSRALRPGELVAGALDVRVLDGGPVALEVIASEPDADPLASAGGPELPGDGHGRRGEFDLTTVPALALTYAAGSVDPAPFSIGTPTIPNLRPGGRALGGDYGVVRVLSLRMNNPGTAPATVYFFEYPAGGSATTTLWFAGDPRPTEIPCVIRPNRYTIRQFDLGPGESRTVTGDYMTDGTSSFPLLFGLTATPPSPPPGPYDADACNPRTPPASPAPAMSPPVGPVVPPPPPLPLSPSPSPAPNAGQRTP